MQRSIKLPSIAGATAKPAPAAQALDAKREVVKLPKLSTGTKVTDPRSVKTLKLDSISEDKKPTSQGAAIESKQVVLDKYASVSKIDASLKALGIFQPTIRSTNAKIQYFNLVPALIKMINSYLMKNLQRFVYNPLSSNRVRNSKPKDLPLLIREVISIDTWDFSHGGYILNLDFIPDLKKENLFKLINKKFRKLMDARIAKLEEEAEKQINQYKDTHAHDPLLGKLIQSINMHTEHLIQRINKGFDILLDAANIHFTDEEKVRISEIYFLTEIIHQGILEPLAVIKAALANNEIDIAIAYCRLIEIFENVKNKLNKPIIFKSKYMSGDGLSEVMIPTGDYKEFLEFNVILDQAIALVLSVRENLKEKKLLPDTHQLGLI